MKSVQQSLGGSVVERFTTLRGNDEKPHSPAEEKTVAIRRQQAVEALRQAAVELDGAANRLERLELYRQADALREQAQRLRLDARGPGGGGEASRQPSAYRPWEWNDAGPPTPKTTPAPSPGLAPIQPPSAAPGPASPDNRQNTPVPSLQPVPQPE